MPDYIVQKAVSPDKVKKKLQRTLAEYGQTFLAQRKYDGCCAVVFTGTPDTPPICRSRTGEVYVSMERAAQELREEVGYSHVVIGEAWWPGRDQFNLISGEFRRGMVSERLSLLANDCLTYEEFAAGHSPVPYRDRLDRLPISAGNRWGKVASWAPGTYGCPQEFCNKLVAEGGYDGLILRDPEGTWTQGSGTTGEIIKIKRVLSFDLRCIGYEAGQGKHAGRMGAIVVDFRGKPLRVGTGFTDGQRGDPEQFRDAIVEVEAMDYSSDGLLREPRFKGIRHDKLAPDT